MNHAGHSMMRKFPEVFNQDVINIINFIDYWDQHSVAAQKLLSQA